MTTKAENSAHKPKTTIICHNETIQTGEFYALTVNRFLFRGRLRPGQVLKMRKGGLAKAGDLVQLADSSLTSHLIAEYQDGMKYTAVCVSVTIPAEEFENAFKKLPKEYSRVVYMLNGATRYSPWFGSISTAFKALAILKEKYSCEADVYFSYNPVNSSI